MGALATTLPYQLSKALSGTLQEYFVDGFPFCWFGTTNATFDLVHGAGFEMSPPSNTTLGGSYKIIALATTGNTSGSMAAWNLSLINFSGNDQMVAWSTTLSSFPGTNGTAISEWTIGFGSLDSQYPVFNWDILGTKLIKEIENLPSIFATGRFYGFCGARLFSEFTQVQGATATFVTGSIELQTTSGTLATVVARGISPGISSPGYAVLYGSLVGTVGSIGAIPIATFRKYINDPMDTYPDYGGRWRAVPSGDEWVATFFLNISFTS